MNIKSRAQKRQNKKFKFWNVLGGHKSYGLLQGVIPFSHVGTKCRIMADDLSSILLGHVSVVRVEIFPSPFCHGWTKSRIPRSSMSFQEGELLLRFWGPPLRSRGRHEEPSVSQILKRGGKEEPRNMSRKMLLTRR